MFNISGRDRCLFLLLGEMRVGSVCIDMEEEEEKEEDEEKEEEEGEGEG